MSRTVINTSAVEFDVGSPTSEACPIEKKKKKTVYAVHDCSLKKIAMITFWGLESLHTLCSPRVASPVSLACVRVRVFSSLVCRLPKP